MSEETIQRAKETLGTWRAANKQLDKIVQMKIESELLKSPLKMAAYLRGDLKLERTMWVTGD